MKVEIQKVVPTTMVKEEQGAEMGRLAARLVERRWRDKEFGTAAAEIEAMARKHGHTPKQEEAGEEQEGGGAGGPDSADM